MELSEAILQTMQMHKDSPKGDRHNEALLIFNMYTFDNWYTGDLFFEKYGTGAPVEGSERPFERYQDYEDLLEILENSDSVKYKIMFKGTPFYIMAWLCFHMKHYEKGVYYMDAAISEDIKKEIQKHRIINNTDDRTDEVLASILQPAWLQSHAAHFFTLNSPPDFPGIMKIRDQFKSRLENELTRFINVCGINLTQTDFNNRFVPVLTREKKSRSIITALYSFLLEYDEIKKIVLLRSSMGGSMEPILTYLFKGGLILESLFKVKYPNLVTMGDANNEISFVAKYGRFTTTAHSLTNIVQAITGNDVSNALNTTGKLRNTTGHNLQWDDVFNNAANFDLLYYQQVNAIFYFLNGDF